jgi:hypothetical protein
MHYAGKCKKNIVNEGGNELQLITIEWLNKK